VLPCNLEDMADSKKQIVAAVLGKNDVNLKYLQCLVDCTVEFDRNDLTFNVSAKNAPAMRVVKEQIADLLEHVKGRLTTADDTTCGSASDTESLEECDAENSTDWKEDQTSMQQAEDGSDRKGEETSCDWRQEVQKYNFTCEPAWRVPVGLEIDDVDGGDVARSSDGDDEADGVCTVDRVVFRAWTCAGCETVNYEALSSRCQWCRKSCVTTL